MEENSQGDKAPESVTDDSAPTNTDLKSSETPESSSPSHDSCRPKDDTVAPSTNEKNHALCSVCVEIGNTNPTQTYCFDCGRTMCELCDLNHRQISAFNQHVRITIDDGKGDNLEEKVQSLVCRHHDNMIQSYCWDCSCPVCSVCLIFEHKDHTIKAFAYQPAPQQVNNYDRLQGLIETRVRDLQAKMEAINSLKAQQKAQSHRQEVENHRKEVENHRREIRKNRQEIQNHVCIRHNETPRNISQVQEKVDKAKNVAQVLTQQAESFETRKKRMLEQRRKELAELQALKDRISRLSVDPDSSEQGIQTPGSDVSPPGEPTDEGILVETIVQQAEVIKHKQEELCRLKNLREQLQQLEVKSSAELESALDVNHHKAPKNASPHCCLAKQDHLSAASLNDHSLPSLTDPEIMMAIIKDIGEQIPKFREHADKNVNVAGILPGDLEFNLPEVMQFVSLRDSMDSHHPSSGGDTDKAKSNAEKMSGSGDKLNTLV